MKNKLFYTKKYKKVTEKILEFLNDQDSKKLGIPNTPREIGDRVGRVLANNFEDFVGDFGTEFFADDAHKKIANVTFRGSDGIKYFINVVTHRISAKFSRPNITAVERLAKLYEDDNNVFVVLVVHYDTNVSKDCFKEISFLPIEFISWESLTFGLLGRGQVQIEKAKDIIENFGCNRKEWMLEFAKQLNRFYVDAADKIVKQLKLSHKIQDDWDEKEDLWK